ncbi:ABC transporter permease [Stappia indica]|uniref:ABC transporter permease subunit n=1 Tax=Stappia indica TaxID=538381 RepID=A0A857CAH1_9HYPH|nr:ABC transporter permease subunit [Stappia indica]QGZ36006.1 ABC transporter permease subunit [Stappia indica]
MLRLAPVLALALMLGPVAAGLLGTLLPAAGYVPVLGGTAVSLEPLRMLLTQPGIGMSAALSLGTGLVATFGAFAAVILFTAAFEGTRFFRALRRLLSPLMAVPHAAAAFGLAFLIAPSGFAMRLLSPWATGFQRPPDLLIVGDPLGLTMTLGLMAKEIPFLFLMLLAALPQADALRSRRVAASLGYAPVAAWLTTVLPRVYPQIRLPVFAVLAYATSVVDVALILGPTTPPPLAVRLTGWMNDPDLSLRFMASAGALAQLGLSLLAILVWMIGERLAAKLGRRWIESGRRSAAEPLAAALSGTAMVALAGAMLAGLALLALWSVAGPWRFPDPLPHHLTLRAWTMHAHAAGDAIAVTIAIALPVVIVAIALALACLEGETRDGRTIRHRSLPLLYLPLIVPQIAFVFGLQVLFLMAGLHDTLLAVALGHMVFVLPYVFLALSDPWRAIDPRYGHMAGALGASPARTFWRVRLPLARKAVATAAALGFAVSVAQYLPTLLIGGGRISTVTTEAVALAAGGNRQLVGIYALLQMLLPFAAFLLAAAVPGIAHRRRPENEATA